MSVAGSQAPSVSPPAPASQKPPTIGPPITPGPHSNPGSRTTSAPQTSTTPSPGCTLSQSGGDPNETGTLQENLSATEKSLFYRHSL